MRCVFYCEIDPGLWCQGSARFVPLPVCLFVCASRWVISVETSPSQRARLRAFVPPSAAPVAPALKPGDRKILNQITSSCSPRAWVARPLRSTTGRCCSPHRLGINRPLSNNKIAPCSPPTRPSQLAARLLASRFAGLVRVCAAVLGDACGEGGRGGASQLKQSGCGVWSCPGRALGHRCGAGPCCPRSVSEDRL